MKCFLSSTIWLAVAVSLLGGSSAFAQRDAGSKIRGDADNFYSGSAGGMYQRHAYDHALILQDYSTAGQPVPKTILQEHATAVRSNVEKSQRAYSSLSDSTKKDKEAAKLLASIEQHQSNALKMCDMLDAECAKPSGESATVMKCCATAADELKAAHEEHEKLMKLLKSSAPAKK